MSAGAAARTPAGVRLVPVPRPRLVTAGRGAAGLTLVPATPQAPIPDPRTWQDDDEPAPTAADLGHLPDPRRWTALLAQAVIEILAGRRPVAQVVRWTDPEVYERIRRSAPREAAARGGPPVRVRRVRVSTSLDGAVEAVAVIDDGTRCRALAVRLDALQRRWLCTALDLV